MKILLIIYTFYPEDSPNYYRWSNILKEWRSRGFKVYVLSYQKPGFSKYEEINGMKIYRVKNKFIEKVKSLINKKNKNISLASSAYKKNSNRSFLKVLHDYTWKKLYFPDHAFLWKKPAYKKASDIISRENIYNVITVSWPFSNHVVGYKLKKKLNINWIADTIDPFCLSSAVNNQFLYSKINCRYEKKIISDADSAIVLTEKLKQKYLELFPKLENKVFVNHNLFIPYEYNPIKKSRDKDNIRLVYIGTLTPITRTPFHFLRFFENLLIYQKKNKKIHFHLYGNTDQCNSIFDKFKHLLNKSIFIHGEIPREKVQDVIIDADILVNIGNTNEYQEPSKILEYIYLNKPIINFCNISEDTSKVLLEKYSNSINIYKEDINEKNKLKDVIRFITKEYSEIIDNKNLKTLENYSVSEVEYRYRKLLIKK